MNKTITITITAVIACVFPMLANASTVAAVPEPSTIVAGGILLVPFALSAVRILRKNRK